MSSNNNKKTPIKFVILFYAILLIGVIALVVIDQVSKNWIVVNMQSALDPLRATPGSSITVIPGVIDFSYLGNTGAAWSMFSGGRIFFIVLTFVFIVAALIAYGKIPFTKKNVGLHVLIITMMAGAVGNLCDRINNVVVIDGIEQSYVVDFIKTTFVDFPTFNVADIYVSVSVVVLIILLLFFYKDDKSSEKSVEKSSDEIETYVIHKNDDNETIIIHEEETGSEGNVDISKE